MSTDDDVLPGDEHQRGYVFLTDPEIELLELGAQELSVEEMAARLGLQPAEIRKLQTEIQAKLGAKSFGEAVLFAADHGGLWAPEAIADEIMAARAHWPLSEADRWLIRAMAAGATPESFSRLLNKPLQRALSLARIGGLDAPALTPSELEHLSHAARGHTDLKCGRDCERLGSGSENRHARELILLKLGARNMTIAVVVAIRSGQLQPPAELLDQIRRLQRDGLSSSLRGIVRDVAAGKSRQEIAEGRGITPQTVNSRMRDFYVTLELDPSGLREVTATALVLWARPGNPPVPPMLDATTIAVLHCLALDYVPAQVAASLGISTAAVRNSTRQLHRVLGSGLATLVARAAKLGILRLPTTLNEQRRLLREERKSVVYDIELRVVQAVIEANEPNRGTTIVYAKAANELSMSVSSASAHVENMCESLGIGPLSAIALLVEEGLVAVAEFTPVLEPAGTPLCAELGDGPFPWELAGAGPAAVDGRPEGTRR
jgi:DNA-binding CsgD family transcriptional regulator